MNENAVYRKFHYSAVILLQQLLYVCVMVQALGMD